LRAAVSMMGRGRATRSGRARGAAALAVVRESSSPPGPSGALMRTSMRVPGRRLVNSSRRDFRRSPAGLPESGSNSGGSQTRSVSGPSGAAVTASVGAEVGVDVGGVGGRFVGPADVMAVHPAVNNNRRRSSRFIGFLSDSSAALPVDLLRFRCRNNPPSRRGNGCSGRGSIYIRLARPRG
jgi:hypothetical protein